MEFFDLLQVNYRQEEQDGLEIFDPLHHHCLLF